MTTATQPALAPLTPHDRCDAACPQAALVRVMFSEHRELTLCSHHYTAHRAQLEQIAIAIRDDRARMIL